MRKTIILTLVALMAALMAVPALAEQITYSGGTNGYNITGELNPDPSYVYPNGNISSSWTGTRTMGTKEFNITIDGWAEGTVGTGYCLDPYAYVASGNLDVILPSTAASYNSSVFATDGALKAAWLMDNYAPGMGNSTYTGLNLAATITAVQLAIWEVVSDEVFDLDNGVFSYVSASSYSSAIQSAAAAMLAALSTAYGTGFSDAVVADLNTRYRVVTDGTAGATEGDNYQDLIVGNNNASGTPEPGTLVLLGSAGGFMALRRRRRAQA